MKKGAIVAFLVLLSAALWLFLTMFPDGEKTTNDEPVKDTRYSAKIPKDKDEEEEAEVEVAPTYKDAPPETKEKWPRDENFPIGVGSYSGPRPLSEEELDKMDENFEKLEEGWDERMKKLMKEELGLSETDYEDYQKMRDGYEEDRLEAFEDFHEKMAREKGLHYSYSPTVEMKDFENKLKTEYQDLFRKRFGEEAYVRYQNALESFNDQSRRNAGPDQGILFIEY